MRKLIHAALSISLVLSLLAITAMLIGHDQSEPELFKYLYLCDGQPCYLGIVPGKNTWNDAIATFEDTPGMQFDPDINIAANPPGFQGSAMILNQGDRTVASQIVLGMRASKISIGDLVLQFGVPCKVTRVTTPNLIIAYFSGGMSVSILAAELDMDRFLNANTPPDQIFLSNTWKSCNAHLDNPMDHPWQGFVRYTN